MENDIGNKDKRSFWSRKVSIWHIIYLVLICLIINIFLLCIVPGRINESAYQNFTFAATITSIVLAVVSIVYSLQSGLSSVGQLNGIKDIESKIGEELTRFSNLESSIKQAVKEGISPLEASLGNIQQRQDDLQKTQDVLFKNWKEFMHPIKVDLKSSIEQVAEVKEEHGDRVIAEDAPQIFFVILYTCLKSKKTGKDIPYHILSKFFGKRSYYCEGVINGLSVFNRQILKTSEGTKNTRQVVTTYDEGKLGDEDWLVKQVIEGKNTKLGKAIKESLDEYFESEDSNDSID